MTSNGLLTKEDYSVTCIICGSQDRVALVPHRVNGKVSGIFCFCEKCFPEYSGASLQIEWTLDVEKVSTTDKQT
jgi:hypothetical protein